ncbi:MAG: rhomboid family intramembrane serine protease [Hyphomicrobiaceae bacterium]
MFVPIYDGKDLKHIKFQYVTLLLISLNVACFAFQMSAIEAPVIASFAVVPVELASVSIFGGHAIYSGETLPIPEFYTLLTYMFFHGDLLHIAGNMLFLWVFGDNVEDACGHARFLVLYLACGVIGGLTHVAFQVNSDAPLIGASAAVAGVIAAYLVLHPRVRVWVLAFKIIPLRIPAAWLLGAWIAMQIVMVLLPQTGPIAWWAHIGGIVAGAVLVVVLRRPGVVLFDQGVTSTRSV